MKVVLIHADLFADDLAYSVPDDVGVDCAGVVHEVPDALRSDDLAYSAIFRRKSRRQRMSKIQRRNSQADALCDAAPASAARASGNQFADCGSRLDAISRDAAFACKLAAEFPRGCMRRSTGGSPQPPGIGRLRRQQINLNFEVHVQACPEQGCP